MKVLLLGYGEMGHAFEFLLNENHEIHIWSLEVPGNLEAETSNADVIIFCLPVNAHDEVVQRILPHVQVNTLCLTIAKGLNEAGLTAHQIFKTSLKNAAPYGVIYGPMISEEIRRDRFAFADVALSSNADFSVITRLFAGSKLLYRHSSDMTGISWSVILKNVYAILFGIADGLQLGDNMRGHLVVNSIAELSSIVILKGGMASSVNGYAGLGDLITTATSVDSHHHELGRSIAKGDFSSLHGEGVHTLQMVEKYGLINTLEYPLFKLAAEILQQPQNLPALMAGYMQRLL